MKGGLMNAPKNLKVSNFIDELSAGEMVVALEEIKNRMAVTIDESLKIIDAEDQVTLKIIEEDKKDLLVLTERLQEIIENFNGEC
jgi:hypothetical protein